VTAALVAGMVIGAGLWRIWVGLHPPPEPLGDALARLDAPHFEPVSRSGSERDTRFGAWLLSRLPALARAVDRARSDLRAVEQTPEEVAAQVGSSVLVALFIGPWFGLAFRAAGLDLPLALPGMVALAGAAWGVIAPFRSLRTRARARRSAFLNALGGYCNVTAMCLASGRGVQQALNTAAMRGRGWAFRELRGALAAGDVRGEPPWEALHRLGVELGVTDLSELAHTIAIAGTEGAAVRRSVHAKSQTIHERLTAAAESEAIAVTERMGLPIVFMALGFLVFLGYPALVTISGIA
jgi:Flp pilus assembly protein TadB